MKIGEIWEYIGEFEPAEDGKRWTDDPFGEWMMDKVKIINFNHTMHEMDGEMVEFESLGDEPRPMEVVFAMPKVLFLKEYRKVYD